MSESKSIYDLFAGSKPVEELIHSYLYTDRLADPQKVTLQNYYQMMYSDVCGFTGMKEKLPPLIVTFSRSRKTDILRLKGKEYLVYDQYLGQTLNMLNRIYFNSNEPFHIQMYACKYLAEQLRVLCNHHGAINFAKAYSELKISSPLPINNVEQRSIYTLAQETFLIAHELAHLAFRYSDEMKKEFFEDAQQTVEEALQRYAIDTDTPEENNILERYNFPREDFKKARLDLQQQAQHAILTRPHLVEEIACDSFANLVTFGTMGGVHKMEEIDFIESISMCMRHLRLLEFFKSLLDYYCDKPQDDFHTSTRSVQLRITSNRLEYNTFFFTDPTRPNEINDHLNNMSNRYAEIIDDPLLFSFPAKLKKIKEHDNMESLSHNSQIYFGSRKFMDMVFYDVDLLTGWA